MNHTETLFSIFKGVLRLPDDATAWLLGLWHVTQVLDDVVDGDPVTRQDADKAIALALIGMPASKFWLRNHATLVPVLLLSVAKWQAADKREREGNADAMSFSWRASYYDVVMAVCQIVHNDPMAEAVMKIYGESFAEYQTEFQNA